MISHKISGNKNLKIRYLLWLYKTTKEELERIDRKFTQLEIDEFMLRKLKKRKTAEKYLNEFKNYIGNKRKDALNLKFDKAGNLSPKYQFLSLKLSTIESAVKKFFDKKRLNEIKSLYCQEMIKRILEERQHK